MTWLTLGNVAVKPLWFVFITAACMRVLGSAGYGLMTASLALAAIVAAFSDWGLGDFTVREAARAPGDISALFSNLVLIRVALGLGAALVTLGIGLALGYHGAEAGALAAATLYTGALRVMEYCRSFYRAFEVLRYEAVSVFTDRALAIAGGLAGLLLTRTAAGALTGMGLALVVALLLNVAWIHARLTPFARRHLDVRFATRALVSAIPLGVYGFLSIAFLSGGTVILEAVRGPSEAGQFGAAYRLVETLALLPSIVTAAVLPRLSTLYHRSDPAFRQVLGKSVAIVGGLAVAAALTLTAFGPQVLGLLSGEADFGGAAALSRLIGWQFPLSSLSAVLGAALIAAGEARFLAVVLAVVVPVNLALNAALVPAYSYYGTTVALLIGQALATGAFAWRTLRILPPAHA